ncbi:hypothetical protein [Salinisphaera aquimarina]|uniref:Uncharacterized protein n=1 Tax=Salinisphaera aquimarina TaxID=2094031 RepID=A0ABV7ELH4_9GAMM
MAARPSSPGLSHSRNASGSPLFFILFQPYRSRMLSDSTNTHVAAPSLDAIYGCMHSIGTNLAPTAP